MTTSDSTSRARLTTPKIADDVKSAQFVFRFIQFDFALLIHLTPKLVRMTSDELCGGPGGTSCSLNDRARMWPVNKQMKIPGCVSHTRPDAALRDSNADV